MKMLWVGIFIVAVIALLAVVFYPRSDNSYMQTNEDSGLGQEETSQEANEVPNDSEIPADTVVETDAPDVKEEITLSVLATHDSKSDCWIAYDGKVYDITKFLPVHPGSSAAIEPYCGTAEEFENAFTKKHGTSKISMLQKQGELQGDLA